LKFGAPGTADIVILPTKLLGAIYVAIGIFLAANKDYFQNLDTAKRVLSALLAILLWPLLLLGVNLHIR
jgi:Mn2+/Fe2+ NRAMP family transporter